MTILKPLDLRGAPRVSGLDAAMALLGLLMVVMGDTREVPLHGIVQEQLEVVMERALIAFDRQDIVAFAIDHLLGDFLLTTHGINRHRGILQLEHLQKFGDGGDLIALVLCGDLPENRVVLMDPGADQVNGGLPTGPVDAPSDRLAVDGDELALAGTRQVGNPGLETSFEGLWIQGRKDPSKRIVRRDTVGQFQEGL